MIYIIRVNAVLFLLVFQTPVSPSALLSGDSGV